MTRIYITGPFAMAILVSLNIFHASPAVADPTRAVHSSAGASVQSGTAAHRPHAAKFIALSTSGKPQGIIDPPPNLVLLPVEGPLQTELDPSVIYKFKSRQEDPSPSEFSYLAGVLQKSTQVALKENLGNVVRWQDTVPGKEITAQPDLLSAGKRAGAKFTLSSTIEEVRFEGNVLLGPWYQMRVSCKLVETATGRVLWHMSNKKFEKFHKVDSGKRPAQIMEEILLPGVSEHIASEVLRVANTR